jgi:hypothetical protein
MSVLAQIHRTQAEIDAADGLSALVRPPILAYVVAADPFDQAPVLGSDAPDVCENLS